MRPYNTIDKEASYLHILVIFWKKGDGADQNQTSQVLNEDLPIVVFILEAHKEHAIGLENVTFMQDVPLATEVGEYDQWESNDNKANKNDR